MTRDITRYVFILEVCMGFANWMNSSAHTSLGWSSSVNSIFVFLLELEDLVKDLDLC